MSYCAAVNCNHGRKKNKEYSYHKFPLHDKELLKKWLHNMKRDFQPTKNSTLCSAHFEPTSFYVAINYHKLKENAIPTIFGLPIHLEKVVPCKRSTSNSTANPLTSIENKNKKIKLLPIVALSEEQRLLKEYFNKDIQILKSHSDLKKSRTLVNQLKMEKNKHLNKIAKMKDVIRKLKNKELLHGGDEDFILSNYFEDSTVNLLKNYMKAGGIKTLGKLTIQMN